MNYTINYYNENAEAFIAGTLDVDLSDIHHRFLSQIPKDASILDLGCGSGRDSKLFFDLGYDVTAVDGSPELCRRAEEFIGIPVRCLLFEDLDYSNQFDAVWACASLLHVEKKNMQTVLRRVANSLKRNGILYVSYKYGTEQHILNHRLFSDYTEADIPSLFPDSGSLVCQQWWITEDARPDRSHEKWLNILCRKVRDT